MGQAAADRALKRLRAILDEHNTGHGVVFDSRAWIVTARRRGTAAYSALNASIGSTPETRRAGR